MSLREQRRIQVVIADDHPVVREGLRSVLLTAADMEVIGEAGTGAEAVAQAQALQPEVMLLDIRMPDGNGLAVLNQIKAVSPDTSVIMVTMHDNPDYIFRAVAAGAAGYVLKEANRHDLLTAIRTVLNPSAAPTPVLLSRSQRVPFNAAQRRRRPAPRRLARSNAKSAQRNQLAVALQLGHRPPAGFRPHPRGCRSYPPRAH